MDSDLPRQVRKLRTPSHVCPLYQTEAEQHAVAVAFVEEGLRRGEHCVLLLSPSSERLSAAFRGRGIALSSERKAGALELSSAAEASMRDGVFEPDLLIDWLTRTEREVRSSGFTGLRVLSDATFATGQSGMEGRLLEYEAKVEEWVARSSVSVICLYDRTRADASVLYDVLRIHPVAVLGELVCPNPYHEPASLILPFGADSSAELRRRRAEYWMARLYDARAAELERERLSVERTRLTTELQEAQKMAMVAQLAGGVAHEFNNFLAVIACYVQATRSRMPEDDPEHSLLEQIQQATESASSLARQLSSLGRRDHGARVAIDLNEVVRNNDQILRILVGRRVELALRLEPALERVVMDPGEARQVLLNVAVNARDAMGGSGTFVVETRNVMLDHPSPLARERGMYVELKVTDDGAGMPKEVAERVFEPFFTTKPAGQGTGLGLSIVARIVEEVGGSIDVHSEQGAGTTFRILLPAARTGA